MTLALQKKRVDADAHKGREQHRSEVISQMRELHAPGYPSCQRFISRTWDRPSELAQIIFYACKR
jgi:hypothetical protein